MAAPVDRFSFGMKSRPMGYMISILIIVLKNVENLKLFLLSPARVSVGRRFDMFCPSTYIEHPNGLTATDPSREPDTTPQIR